MSLYTPEKWNEIVAKARRNVQHADEQATRADEQLKVHVTPHYEMVTCPECKGTKVVGLFIKGTCRRCEGSGQVQGSSATYNCPGDPHGWWEWTATGSPALARLELRQTLIRRFVDLHPEHPLSVAITQRLVTPDPLQAEEPDFHSSVRSMFYPTGDIVLPDGTRYPPSTWEDIGEPA